MGYYSGSGSSWATDANSQGNVCVGNYTMTGTQDGANHNICLGYSSGNDITTGDYNTLIGQDAGALITSGTSNIVLGATALDAATTQSLCIAIGYNALTSLNHNDASGTVAIGYLAGEDITSGQYNTAVGYQALKDTVDGNANTALGYNALLVNTTGSNNTALGYATLGGSQNVGDANTAVGSNALTNFNPASDDVGHNTGLGYESGASLTTGVENTYVGSGAGYRNATGDNNTYVGYRAGLGASGQSHSSNTAVGKSALEAITNGVQNTVMGHLAGDAITTGDGNVIIGYGSIAGNVDAQNRVAIGHTATGQADNSVTLGNADVTAVYMASDKGADVYCRELYASSEIGIGLESPATDLHIWNASGESTIRVDGGEGGVARLMLNADQADDNADYQDIYAGTDGSMAFRSYSTGSWVNRMKINSAGDIYIAGINCFRAESNTLYVGSPVSTDKNTALQLRTNDAPAIDIDSSQNVSIGSPAQTVKFGVQEDVNDIIEYMDNGATSGNVYIAKWKFTGKSPDDNTSYFVAMEDASADRCKIWSDGDVNNSDNAYGSLSDVRIKQGIRDANSQWDDIKAIKVRNFKKNADVDQYGDNAWEQIGVVAQELEASGMDKLVKEHPASENEARTGDGSFKEGDMIKSVSYSVLYMKAIKALQEAMTKIETLESKVAALEG